MKTSLSIAQNVAGFNYSSVSPDVAEQLRGHANTVLSLARKVARDMITIGEHLHDARQILPKGTFCAWVKSALRITTANAFSLISIAERFADHADELDNLVPTALIALSRSYVPDVARHEAIARAAAGETITPAIAGEIVEKHEAEWLPTKQGPKPQSTRLKLRRHEQQALGKLFERVKAAFFLERKAILKDLFQQMDTAFGNDLRLAWREWESESVPRELGIVE